MPALYATTAQATDRRSTTATASGSRPKPSPTPRQELLDRLNVTAAKNLVTVDDPDAADVAELVDSRPGSRAAPRAPGTPAKSSDLRRGRTRPPLAALEAAVATREHVAVGRRVRAIDRDNVGLVVDIDDNAGTCLVHFENTDGRTAIKTLAGRSSSSSTTPTPSTSPPPPSHTLDRPPCRRGRRTRAGPTRSPSTASNPATPTATGAPPTSPSTVPPTTPRPSSPSGSPPGSVHGPTTAAGAAVWDDAITRIAHHRCLHNVDPDEPGLGPDRSTQTPASGKH